MRLYIASDHAAFKAKAFLMEALGATHQLIDLGTDSEESCHYPKFAISLVREMSRDPGSRGILLCGNGIGVSIAANRFKGIRASRCVSVEDAIMTRKHNDSNIICLGARVSSEEDMLKMSRAWLETEFEGGRHLNRVQMFDHLGERA